MPIMMLKVLHQIFTLSHTKFHQQQAQNH